MPAVGGYIGGSSPPGRTFSFLAGNSIWIAKNVTALQNATATAVLIEQSGGAGINVRAVVYDGTPSALLASSAVVANPAAGVIRLQLSTPLVLTAGSNYYVGYIADGNPSIAFGGPIGASAYIVGGQTAASPPNPITGTSVGNNQPFVALELDGTGQLSSGFSPLDVTSGVTLTSSNSIATFTGAANLGARSTIKNVSGTGKYYAEVVIGGTINNSSGVGLTTANATPWQSMVSSYCWTYILLPTGVMNGVSLGLTYVSGDVIGIAYDSVNNFVWWNKNNGSWFGASSTAGNPVTPSGGAAVAAAGPTSAWPMRIAVGTGATAAVFTLRDTAASQQYASPSGFTAWTPSTNTTWNPSDKSANVTLTGSNLIATSASASVVSVRAIDKQVTGKFYWEYTYNTALFGTGGGVSWGGNAHPFSWSAGAIPGACGLLASGQIYADGSASLIIGGGGGTISFGTITAGTVVCVALNADAKLIWFRLGAAGNWNNLAGRDPATGAGGVSIPDLGGGIQIYPAASFGTSGNQITANFGDSAFTGTVPSGFISGFPAGVTSSTNAIATQAALEEWVASNPLLQVTQVSLEQWASVAAYVPPVPGKGRVWIQA